MGSDGSNVSIAAFTALGTIVGYLGAEVPSPSIFDRLLWPSRFYNTRNPTSLLAIVLSMPMGGPIHKAAMATLERLVSAGLFKGYCRGDMLGTAFFNDTGHRYVEHTAGSTTTGSPKEARNAFWITVMELLDWKPPPANIQSPGDAVAAEKIVRDVRAHRPVAVLELSRVSSRSSAKDPSLPRVDGDLGTSLNLRCLVAILASEAITVVFGVITAAVWNSLFAIWYLSPLFLKLVALFARVRRLPLEPPPSSEMGEGSQERLQPATAPAVYEVVDFSTGFFLITGPPELVLQFFRHYGHPIRGRTGLRGDRVWEMLSILTVITFALVYPAGLIAFIFAPISVQWVWLGYQIYTVVSMHIYRFGGGDHVGTTEAWVARELSNRKMVSLAAGGGNEVIAKLSSSVVPSVHEGRRQVATHVSGIWTTNPDSLHRTNDASLERRRSGAPS